MPAVRPPRRIIPPDELSTSSRWDVRPRRLPIPSSLSRNGGFSARFDGERLLVRGHSPLTKNCRDVCEGTITTTRAASISKRAATRQPCRAKGGLPSNRQSFAARLTHLLARSPGCRFISLPIARGFVRVRIVLRRSERNIIQNNRTPEVQLCSFRAGDLKFLGALDARTLRLHCVRTNILRVWRAMRSRYQRSEWRVAIRTLLRAYGLCFSCSRPVGRARKQGRYRQ